MNRRLLPVALVIAAAAADGAGSHELAFYALLEGTEAVVLVRLSSARRFAPRNVAAWSKSVTERRPSAPIVRLSFPTFWAELWRVIIAPRLINWC